MYVVCILLIIEIGLILILVPIKKCRLHWNFVEKNWFVVFWKNREGWKRKQDILLATPRFFLHHVEKQTEGASKTRVLN